MGKLKQRTSNPAESNKTPLSAMYPPKKVATQAQPLVEVKAKIMPIKPQSWKINWKPTKECKSLIRTPTRKSILRALGFRKGLRIETATEIGTAQQLEWSENKVIGLRSYKEFKVTQKGAEDYIYNTLNVGAMCAKNQRAKKVKRKVA